MCIRNKVNMLEEKIKKGETPSISDFLRVEAELQEIEDKELLKRVILLKEKIYPSKSPTKWELLLAELSLKENIAPVWELAIMLEQNKNKILTMEELSELETQLEKALVCINDTSLFTEKESKRVRNEFTKKIKTFKKRLETDFNREFCRFMKERRMSLGYSLKDVEDLTGISSSHLHRIENSNRRPSIRVIEKLAKVLDIPQSEFLKNMNIGIEKKELSVILDENQFLVNGKQLSKDEIRQIKTYIKGF